MKPPADPDRRPPRERTPRSARRDASDGYSIAKQLQAQRPQWMIIYGCYSHRFWAYPLFPATRRLIIHASYPDALIPRLDQAEQQYRIHRHDGTLSGPEPPTP